MGLLDLIRGTQKPAGDGRATAIRATERKVPAISVAKVAVAPHTDGESSIPPVDRFLDHDSYCWPHSTAMNAAEIELFGKRKQLFLAKGLDEDAADALADKLVGRDRDRDDRRVCLECSNLKGFSRLRCSNWRVADLCISEDNTSVGMDFAALLQRCDGFSS